MRQYRCSRRRWLKRAAILGAGAVISGFCGVKPCNGSVPKEIVVPEAAQGLIHGALAKDGSRLFVADKRVSPIIFA